MCAQKEAVKTKVDEMIERLDRLTHAVETLANALAVSRQNGAMATSAEFDRVMAVRYGLRPSPAQR